VLRRISRQGSILQQLETLRAEKEKLLVQHTASQLAVQQLQRALQRCSAENDSLAALVSSLRVQSTQAQAA
jgi:hypothetical protein